MISSKQMYFDLVSLTENEIDSYIEDAISTIKFVLKSFYVIAAVISLVLVFSWEKIVLLFNYCNEMFNAVFELNELYQQEAEENLFSFTVKTLFLKLNNLVYAFKCKFSFIRRIFTNLKQIKDG